MKKCFAFCIFIFSLIFLSSCNNEQTNPSTDKKEFEIQFVVEGEIVQTSTVKEGEIPKYLGPTPTKEATKEYSYTFSDWTPKIEPANKNQTYNALFEESRNQYEVCFYDFNGKLLDKVSYYYNEIPTYTYEPEDTKEWDYEFYGWGLSMNSDDITDLMPVEGNISYYAKVTFKKQVYNISFVTNGGSELLPLELNYGDILNLDEIKPTRDGYHFVGWCLDENLSIKADSNIEINQDLTLYAAWNEKVDILSYLKALLSGYQMSPYSFLPETLLPNYNPNLVDSSTIAYDFTKFVNVDDIVYGGFGEQWAMVLDNLEQSMNFYNLLSVVDSLSTTAITAFESYLDKNPADTANYEFEDGIYTITIIFENDIMSFGISYEGNFPIFGEQKLELLLSYDVNTGERIGRIELGAANVIKYEVKGNSYTFAIKYLGIRRAYFNINKDANNNVSGHIYEFIELSDKTLSSSAADFYINEEYASVVGNKASGIIGFTGVINELYDVTTGKMQGYEVREILDVAGINVTYNTLWFNLDELKGINTIKVLDGTSSLNKNDIYVNGNDKIFAIKECGGLSLKAKSRRYDIEMRKNYLYTYDSSLDEYTRVEVEIPMLFVQAEYLEELENDIENKNAYLDVKLSTNQGIISKIQDDYAKLIDVFLNNKENITADDILDYIS